LRKILYLALIPPLISGCLGGDNGGVTEVAVTDKGNIEGSVTDSVTGKAIPSVLLKFGTNETITNANGIYTLSLINVGSRTVTAALTGYDNYSGTATITEGITITYDITMNPTNSQQSSSKLHWDKGNWDQIKWQ
jgi:hypothetical protein